MAEHCNIQTQGNHVTQINSAMLHVQYLNSFIAPNSDRWEVNLTTEIHLGVFAFVLLYFKLKLNC